jgi:2,4-dienoyl-CoA reductase-like NADH-dependent reductase (Old Yellow Enzyme family)
MLNADTADGFRMLVDSFRSTGSEALFIVQLSTGKYGSAEDHAGLSSDEILAAKRSLADACVLAAEAGFDGVDFKQCHDILPGRLLSRSNVREDRWGGSCLGERATFAREVVNEVRGRVRERGERRFIVGTRISETDVACLREMVLLFEKDLALDFINLSSYPWQYTFDANVLLPLSQTVKMMDPKAPVVCSGGTDATAGEGSLARVTDLLSRPLAPDFIGFGRQSVADPALPRKIMERRHDEVRWCRKCGGCTKLLFEQKPVRCRVHGSAKRDPAEPSP